MRPVERAHLITHPHVVGVHLSRSFHGQRQVMFGRVSKERKFLRQKHLFSEWLQECLFLTHNSPHLSPYRNSTRLSHLHSAISISIVGKSVSVDVYVIRNVMCNESGDDLKRY